MSLLDSNNLPHLVDIETTTYTRDDMGGEVVTYTTYKANVPAWVQSVFGMEQKEFDKQGFKVTHKVFFNHNPSMSETANRIIWVDSHDKRHVLKMVFERDATAGLGQLHRVECEELPHTADEDSL